VLSTPQDGALILLLERSVAESKYFGKCDLCVHLAIFLLCVVAIVRWAQRLVYQTLHSCQATALANNAKAWYDNQNFRKSD